MSTTTEANSAEDRAFRAFAWLNALNLLDSVLTLSLVHLGAAEVNPLMGALLKHAVLFVVVKLSFVWLSTTLLCLLEWPGVLEFLVAVYLAVVGWELFGLALFATGVFR